MRETVEIGMLCTLCGICLLEDSSKFSGNTVEFSYRMVSFLQNTLKIIGRVQKPVCVLPLLFLWWIHTTVWCRYNTINFLQNTHERHPIACPSGQGMGCLLWFQPLIDILPQLLQWCVQYHDMLDRIITALDCKLFCELKIWSMFCLYWWCAVCIIVLYWTFLQCDPTLLSTYTKTKEVLKLLIYFCMYLIYFCVSSPGESCQMMWSTLPWLNKAYIVLAIKNISWPLDKMVIILQMELLKKGFCI